MIIVFILSIIGFVILWGTGAFNISSFTELYNYLYVHGFAAIISLFFIIIGLYVLIRLILDVIVKEKNVTMCLYDIDKEDTDFSIYTFLDKRGKKINFYSKENNSDYEVGKYYIVSKKNGEIIKIIGQSNQTFELTKIKESYWMNTYTIFGNFEDVLVLPIVYVIALPGVLSAIMSKGFDKIYGIIMAALPVFVIVYDAIYKIKKSKSSYGEGLDNEKGLKVFSGALKAFNGVKVLGISLIVTFLFLGSQTIEEKIIVLPFLIISILLGISFITSHIDDDKIQNVIGKISTCIFLIFWFGMLIFFTYIIITTGQDTTTLLFLIPFVLAGFYMLYAKLIKKK